MKKTKIISVINFKGGVGKSTITYNLASELAEDNKKILMIDFDGQGNLTKFSGIEKNGKCEDNIISALNKIILGEDIKNHPIYPLTDNLCIIPCDIRKENWSNRALSCLARETLLKRYLEIIKKEYDYDYILIDNAPSVNLDFQNSLVASDKYLIVTEPELASTDGIETIFNIICQIKKYLNPELSPAGIIINKTQVNTNLHSLMEGVIRKAWGDNIYVFKTYIPKSIVAGESELLARSINEHNKNSKIAIAFRDLSKEFIEKLEGE